MLDQISQQVSANHMEFPSYGFVHFPSPQLLTPAELEWNWANMRDGRKVVVLRRNPFDTAVSEYHHTIHRDLFYGGKLSFSDFLHSKPWGGPKAYEVFYSKLLLQRELYENSSSTMLIEYERLASDTKLVLTGLLDFMGIRELDIGIVERAVQEASLDNLQAQEKRDSPSIPHDALKFRRGQNFYGTNMSPHDFRYIQAATAQSTRDPDFRIA